MSLSQTFTKLGDDLGTSLGEKKIPVIYIPTTYSTKFIRCYTHLGEVLYYAEEKVRACEELGLSLRRAS